MKSNSLKFLVVALSIIGFFTLYTPLANSATITDNFDGATLNMQLWQPFSYDNVQWFVQQGGELIAHLNGNEFNSGVNGNFLLKGNFDMRVDYRLINLSDSGFVSLGFESGDRANAEMMIRRMNFGVQKYGAFFGDSPSQYNTTIPTTDQSGALRLTREGSVMTGYFWQSGGWQSISFHDYGSGIGESLEMCLSAASWAFVSHDSAIAFDNFNLTYDQIQYNPVPVPGTLLLLGSGLLGLGGWRRFRRN